MLNKKNYTYLLQELKSEGYVFASFDKKELFPKFVLLRHDIDSNLGFALELAKLESTLNIKATYFVMLKSPIYNLFSRNNQKILKQIILLGHEIGLHFDDYNIHESLLQQSINNEVEIFKSSFDIDIKAVSFHQPSQKIIENKIKIYQINTYDHNDMADIFYISDSNANKRVLDIDLLKKYPKLQILIHPMWWVQEEFISTKQSWDNAIINNFYQEELQLLNTERAYGDKRCMQID